MRSSREISFRLKQEIRNLQLLAFPPRFHGAASWPLVGLPAPNATANQLAETDFKAQVLLLADQILAHRFPLLGFTIDTGPTIDWRRDYVNQVSSGARYFRLIPYLDASRVGDHKIIWELNRHQHLVLLAQAFLFENREVYLGAVFDQLESWWQQNPYQRGINWASALEVAFRAFSWIWVYHFIGDRMSRDLRSRFLESLYQHGCHIENNLSFYFSPNTHLLGEAIALHALGHLFPSFPRARNWVETGTQTVVREMQRQIRPDGSHFEQSTYYHVYALDTFLFHALLSTPSPEYLNTLARMADFLHAVMGPSRSLPFLGDDDGGRWFHPYGPRDQFGRATLATCATLLGRDNWTFDTCDLFPQAAWWLGRTEGSGTEGHDSQLFRDSGLAVLHAPSRHILVDAGPFGPGRAGHSHSDSLSIVASASDTPILVDSGTYTYVGDEKLRNAFRGSAAHNTIRIDCRDEAVPAGPFRWNDPPEVALNAWERTRGEDALTATCHYGGFTHRRAVRFVKPHLLLVLDSVEGPRGVHEIEQFWHLASPDMRGRIFLGSPGEDIQVWHSRAFGSKQLGPAVVVRRKTTLPAHFAGAIVLDGIGTVAVIEEAQGARFEWSYGERYGLFELGSFLTPSTAGG